MTHCCSCLFAELTVMMMGCTGRGKTTFCNFLFQEERFKSRKNKLGKRTTWRKAISDVNRAEVDQLEDVVGGVTLTVIDTPGYLATQRRYGNSGGTFTSDTDVMLQEFSRALMYAKDGIDAVLVTLRCADPPSVEEEMLLEFLTEMQIWKHCIILFTHGAEVSNDGDEGYLELHRGLNSGEFAKECPVLSKFVENCNRRFLIVESVEKAGDKLYHRSKLDELYSDVEITSKNAESALTHPLLEMAKNSYQMIQMHKSLREEADDKEAQLKAIVKEKARVTTRLNVAEKRCTDLTEEKDKVMTRLNDAEKEKVKVTTRLDVAEKRCTDLTKEKNRVTARLDVAEKRCKELETALQNDAQEVANGAPNAEQDAEDAAAMLLEYLRASEATDASPTRFVSAIRRLEAAEKKQRKRWLSWTNSWKTSRQKRQNDCHVLNWRKNLSLL